MYLEIAIVILLTLTNGALAMSELAIVSSRPARLKVLADQGRSGAAVALALLDNPGRFLSTVQIGITLVGVLSGAFSGATLGARLANALEAGGMSNAAANTIGVGAVVAVITYLSLILGELVPKQIALKNPESVAARVAPAMRTIALVTTPIVWFLDVSGRTVLRLLGQHGESEAKMTDEEVKMTLAEADSAGVFAKGEREMIQGVMRVADRTARALMTPRREVEVLDLDADPEGVLEQARSTRRNRLPVREGGEDEIIGVIAVRELLGWRPEDGPLRELIREAPVVLDATDAGTVIERLKGSRGHMALVYDEYGHFEGIITAMDVLEAIAGVFSDGEEDEPAWAEREDGSWLVAGWMPIDEFADRAGLPRPDGDYDTVAGFVLDRMGRIPALGESITAEGWRFEVIDLDAMRIDKLLVSRAP
ncbi:hemolysin family protein [Frigidibacter sp. MR17.14]|uniref:hemolysin family protein n=1 Tax=Frigidibacter sp. MR17.14 TaxID=3126509 RepID=UPI003012D0E1